MKRRLSSLLHASTFIGLLLVGTEGCGDAFGTADGDAGQDAATSETGVADAGDTGVADAGTGDTGAGDDGSTGGEDAATDASRCAIGEIVCAPCGGRGYCANSCPDIPCYVDAGHPVDAATPDAGVCPPDEHPCSNCGMVSCGQVCPADACVFDAGHPADAAPPDAGVCPGNEHQCPTCGDTPTCGVACPEIACFIDAAIPIDAAGMCVPCNVGAKCCGGGTPGSYSCVKPLNGDVCPLLPQASAQ